MCSSLNRRVHGLLDGGSVPMYVCVCGCAIMSIKCLYSRYLCAVGVIDAKFLSAECQGDALLIFYRLPAQCRRVVHTTKTKKRMS